MPYPARPIPFDPRDYASHESLQRAAAFVPGASATTRQAVIDYVVKVQGFSTSSTKSLLYDASLDRPGRNVAGNVRIGPDAFEQDLAFLAGVVFHELVHSPQYAYYASKGVTQIDPKRSETERRMIALDEYEAYCWTLRRSAELGLSKDQLAEIRSRAERALIDVDDTKASSLAHGGRFDAARDELIRQYSPAPTGAPAAIPRPNCSSCRP